MKRLLHNNLNFKIIIPIIILIIISLITLKNINPLLTDSVSHIDFFKKQVVGFVLGLIGVIIIYNINIKKANKVIDFFYFTLIIMLFILAFSPPILNKLFVNDSNGANGWFMFFTPRLSIQPVEFFKIFLVLKLAVISKKYLESNQKDSYIIKQYFLYALIPIILVLLEPDLGGSVLLLFSSFFMLLMSLKNKKIFKIFLFILIGFLIFILLLILSERFQNLIILLTPLKEYQLERIDAWLDPFNTEKGFQLSQSLIFMGSSGAFGHGGGFELITIPEAHTDLIFVSIVGFYGWVVGLLVIGCYIVLLNEIFNIAIKQRDTEYKLILIGFGSLFFLQVFENIGMMIGLLPITGIVLPFLSYGISALLTYFAIFAIILNISKETKIANTNS